ncbi:MAG: VWA domain-containing protein [Deltaproteobacteria bacterium]|nr:VWA domain-containing protein [Deltaproteobacteria bacterium]
MSLLYPLLTLSFAYPWAFLFPVMLSYFLMVRRRPAQAVLTPSASLLEGATPSLRLRLRTPILGILSFLFVIFLSIAAARPQKLTMLNSPYEARNIMLSIDISRSMSTDDFASKRGNISRMQGVKTVVSQFVTERGEDRIGLVVFGSSAFLQSPLTLDHKLLSEIVDHLEVGLAGDGTAIGDGLGLSLKRIQDLPGESKAVILLTDGVSNSGHVNPIKAAKVAKDLGVKVHTIGIGSADTIGSLQGGFFSGQLRAQAEFDEATLKEIANITGGVYFNAGSIDGLTKVYDQIDRLDRTDAEEPQRQVVEEYFVEYAAAAFVCYLLYLLLARSVFLKVP